MKWFQICISGRFPAVNKLASYHLESFQIKSFIILAVLRRSVQRVYWAHLRVIATACYTAPKKCHNGGEPLAFGSTVSDLTGPRFEPQTSRFRDERVTARPTDQ